MAADRFPALAGSGTAPYMQSILHTTKGGIYAGTFDEARPGPGHGERIGSQVIVANPEDIVASPRWAVSGITVGTAALQIVGADRHPLPRCRKVIITHEQTGTILRVAENPDKLVSEGFPVRPTTTAAGEDSQHVELPLMQGAPIWARFDSGSGEVRMIFIE